MYLIKLGEYFLMKTEPEVDDDDNPVLTRFEEKAWHFEDEELANNWSILVGGEKCQRT